MTLASQPVFSFASATVSNTGRSRWVEPPLPGDVPPTILVPYLMACSEWKVPFLPVKPWQMTLVLRSIRMPMSRGLLHGGDDLLGSVVKIVARRDVELGLGDDLLAKFDVRAFEPHHQRHLQSDLLDRRHHTLGDHIALHDAAEDVDQDT